MAKEKEKVIKSTKAKKIVKNIDIKKEEVMKEIKEDLTGKLKEQITKELIDDIKKDVSTLVKEEVSYELKRDIEKEMKKENKRILRGKRGKIFRRDLIIIILLAIIAYLVYYMYNHNYVSFSIDSNMNNSVVYNDKKSVSVDVDYSYLLDLVNVKLPFDNINSLYLYTDNYTESKINDSIKLTIAYNQIKKDDFTSEELKEAYKKVFGTDENYKGVSFDYECKHFNYIDNKYTLTSDECLNISNKEIVEKIIKVAKKDDVVTLTTVMGIFDNDKNLLYNYKNTFDPVATNLSKNFDIENYQDKLSTYQYKFIYENKEYRFKKITKLS